jgi:S-DNA-T family DNA segregation ATPase FtsK/SpoIIIE
MMDRKRKIQLVTGVVLGAATVFIALAVISYHSTDPGWGDWQSDHRVGNWCGGIGALFSGFVMYYFGGPAAYFGVGLLVFWVYLLLTAREKLWDAYLKIAGSAVLVLSISALTAHVGMGRYFSSVVGSLFADRAALYFGNMGAFVLLLVTTFLSLLVATDFMVVAPLGHAALVAGSIARAGFNKLLITAPWKGKKAPARAEPSGRVVQPERAAVVPVHRPGSPAEKPVKEEKPAEKKEEPKAAVEEPEPAAKEQALAIPAPKPLPVQTKAPAPPAPRPQRKAVSETGYIFPPMTLLDADGVDDATTDDEYIQEKAKVLEDTLAEFGVAVKVVGIETGPVITQYELELAPGIKVNRVVSLSDDIAMALKAPSVRIVAPIPGRDSVGVEVPNTKKAIVRLKSLLEERGAEKAGNIPVYLGRDAQGQPLVTDLTELPHLLIAGATGAGKSVCINSVILSVMMSQHPDDVKLLLVDPKMVELSVYKDVPHLICPVVTDMKKAATILEWACVQMDSRYDLLAAANVRHITRYNKLGAKGIRERLGVPPDAEIEIPDKIPYVIIVIDELADLMMVAAKEIETFITRLAQKSRAVGLHLVLATQRPSVDVITGLIKSNLPARLSFKVSSKIDSRTILDQNGAEKLLGRGDMLFLPPATAKLVRAQGTFVSDDEIRKVVEYSKAQTRPDYDEELVGWKKAESSDVDFSGAGAEGGDMEGGAGDPLYSQAVQIVIENQRGSVSLLQRRLEIGYGRAARLIDLMAERGILGPYKGSQAREVMYTLEQWDEMQKELKGRSR